MLYMVTFTINIPQMLAYIYHTWILFVWYGMQWNASFMATPVREVIGFIQPIDLSTAGFPRKWGHLPLLEEKAELKETDT